MSKDNKSITELARELRNNPTPSERKLWKHLRKLRMGGYRFLRQKPITYRQVNHKAHFFIADFYCAEKLLAVEVDGRYHHNRIQKQYDRNRDLVINKRGIDVLRINNSELKNITSVQKEILHRIEQL